MGAIDISKFEFDGFVPKPELLDMTQQLMSDIEERIPSDACIIGECKKRHGKYYLKLVVNGTSSQFEANTIIDPQSFQRLENEYWLSRAIEALYSNVKLQINRWLKTRQLDC